MGQVMSRCRRCGAIRKEGAGDCASHTLSDMEFDEISFVPRGANQRAHVVLWKSDTEHLDDLFHTRAWIERKAAEYRFKERRAKEQRPVQAQPERPTTPGKMTSHDGREREREIIAKGDVSRTDLLAYARELQVANPDLNVAQAIAKALERRPGLYDPDMPPRADPEPVSKQDPMPAGVAALVDELVRLHPDLTREQALLRVLNQDPTLYELRWAQQSA